MAIKEFVLKLLGTGIISFIMCWLLGMAAPKLAYLDVSCMAIALFTVIALGIYVMSVRATKTKDKNFFIYVILVNIFFKIIASFIVIALYVNAYKPVNKLYLITFTLVYLIFTIFETYFLSIQAKSK